MNRKVLIVDDEEVIRKSLRIHLTKWNYEVTEAGDGVEAILHLGKEPFDLIISDIMMPNKDGWQLLQELRASPARGDIPLILLTAKSRASDMFKGYELGATYFMTKPFTRGQLQYALDLIFGAKEALSGGSDLTLRYSQKEAGTG